MKLLEEINSTKTRNQSSFRILKNDIEENLMEINEVKEYKIPQMSF